MSPRRSRFRRRERPDTQLAQTREPASTHAVQIVHAALREDVSVDDLVRLASADPTFAARTLTAVNSAAFGLRERVSDLTRGAAMLGVRGMRNVALGLVVTSLAPPGEQAETFLGGCMRRAVAAKLLAERARVRVSPDDAFVAGMFTDVALLTLVQAHGETADELARAPAAARVVQERLAGLTPHPARGAELAERWKLSDELVQAIVDHHAPACPEAPLSAIAWGAEQIAAVFEPGAVELNDKRARRSVLEIGVSGHAYDEILALLPEGVNALAAAFEREVPQPEREDLLVDVNQRLVELNQSFLQSLQHMEVLLAEKERLAEDLGEANARLELMARTDSLTGVANRRSMEESLLRDLHRAQRARQPLTLILVDVDHFKQVNDRYGHPVGDSV
ncbi:MAG: HDOD domain-containing protein, partial [Myxococcales bacterium]|nr:HDOD domain-containing protein [Myxococcales bacterium]